MFWLCLECAWDDYDRKPEAVCGISLDMGEYNGIAGNAVKRYHALLVTFFCCELLRR